MGVWEIFDCRFCVFPRICDTKKLRCRRETARLCVSSEKSTVYRYSYTSLWRLSTMTNKNSTIAQRACDVPRHTHTHTHTHVTLIAHLKSHSYRRHLTQLNWTVVIDAGRAAGVDWAFSRVCLSVFCRPYVLALKEIRLDSYQHQTWYTCTL